MAAPVNDPRRALALARARPVASALALPEQHLGAIRQSHERCSALGLSRIGRPDPAPLGRADLGQVRERHQRLHNHAAPVMEMLFGQIEGTQSMVVLCDSAGTIIHSIGDDDFLSRASKVALQPGVNWSEPTKGTNAIGTALFEEQATLVHADEHFLHANHFLTCSAAPIFDPRGNILGVLDVTGDHRSYHPHTMALVTLSARMIENHWLSDDHRHALRLHFHRRADFIGTLMEGILAVSPDGRVVGANRGALEQLGLAGAALRLHNLQTLFGTTVGALVDRLRSTLALPLLVHSAHGGCFHLQAQFSASGRGRPGPAGPGATAPVDPPAAALATGFSAVARGFAGLAALNTGDAQVAAQLDKLRCVLDRGVPVVIVGETGTGKDVLARAFHRDSRRTGQPFVTVACGAVTAAALEAAAQQARGGSLLLAGIDELPTELQVLLLHLLDESDDQLVCASQQALRPGAGPGCLREDLFHRLQGLTVTLPPLRERSDLEALARGMLDADEASRGVQIAQQSLTLLAARRWPGNLRQLHRVLRTAAALAGRRGVIEPGHLPTEPAVAAAAAPAPTSTVPLALQALELQAMQQALQACGGNVSQAARRLGVSRNTIYRRLRSSEAAGG